MLGTEDYSTPRQLWINGLLRKYNSDYTVVKEIFNAETVEISEMIQNALADMQINTDIVNLDTELSSSSFNANYPLSPQQKDR